MKKKSINNIILITLGLILVLAFININIFNHMDYCLDKKNQCSRENLELSDYSSFIEGEGEDINITLHQSLFNSTTLELSNLDIYNKCIQACPSDANFNSSFTNITIEGIKAPNKTLEVETDNQMHQFNIGPTGEPAWAGFRVRGSGILNNISINIYNAAGLSGNLGVQIFNSNWNGSANVPLSQYATVVPYDTVYVDDFEGWFNFTNLNTFLNVSATDNNTFYVRIKDDIDDTYWYMSRDDYDNDDEMDAYKSGYTLITSGPSTVDLTLKVGLSPYIYPSSKRYDLELGNTNAETMWTDEHAFSFKVLRNCILKNFSLCLSEEHGEAEDATIDVFLYDAIYDPGTGKMKPNLNLKKIISDFIIPDDTNRVWFNFTNVNEILNVSYTNNNTFFLGIYQSTPTSNTRAAYHYENDGIDTVDVWTYLGAWELQTIDPSFILGLASLKNSVNPENINLKINDTTIIGYDDIYGSGYWSSTDVYSGSSGQLEFELSADWWNVSCKIIKVQINYTKTDLKASSKFTSMGSGQDVQWNVTLSGGLNFFDPRITHHNTINFTIPATWLNINAFNGPENKTSDIKTRLLNNGYRDAEIIDATNGTFWYLTATSTNLVESIDIYTGSNPISMANYLDVVEFNVTFNKIIGQNDGIINLCVYSPAAINDKLNFTSVNSTFDSGSEFYLGKWDLSDTVIDYGEFRVQVFWNNDTAAGFIEKTLTITGQTDLTLITPTQEATYYTNQSFNIVVYYKDSNQLKAIDGATIQYNINGQGWQSTSSNNGTIGYYIIPVNCSIFTIDGTKAVEITASKNYYENQTLDYNFNVIIVEEKGKPAKGIPLVIIIIAIVSTAGGIGVATVTIVLLRKRKRINKGI